MSYKSIKQKLKEVTMFSSLEEDELSALGEISHLYSYDEGETLFFKGETSNSLLLLVDGIVSIFRHDDKGNEIVIGYFSGYELLAEAATLRHTPLPSSARFQTDGKLIKINLVEFEKLFMAHPKISFAVIESLLKKIDLLQQNIDFNIATTARDRILYFYRKNPKLSLDLKQYEIASILGMSAETLSRNIKILVEKNKLIKVSTGYKILE